MSPKEIVSEGLEARKNVRAAEAREAEVRDAHFQDRLNHEAERNTWKREKESLEFRIELKDQIIDWQTQEIREIIEDMRDTAQIRSILRLLKGVTLFVLLIVARDMDLIVPWLVNWLALAVIVDLTCTVANLPRIKKY